MFRRKSHDNRECLTREQILEMLEGVYGKGGAEEKRLESHLRRCAVCRGFRDEVRREIETQNLSISLAWQRERISCPHRDILHAYLHDSLSGEEKAYIRFHLEEIGCAYCGANLEDLEALEGTKPTRRLRDLKDELLRSTTAFLRSRHEGKE